MTAKGAEGLVCQTRGKRISECAWQPVDLLASLLLPDEFGPTVPQGGRPMVGAVESGPLRAGGGEEVAGRRWAAAPQPLTKGVII